MKTRVIVDLSEFRKIIDPRKEIDDNVIAQWAAVTYQRNHAAPCLFGEEGRFDMVLTFSLMMLEADCDILTYLPFPSDIGTVGPLEFAVSGNYLYIVGDTHGTQTGG